MSLVCEGTVAEAKGNKSSSSLGNKCSVEYLQEETIEPWDYLVYVF